MNKVKRISMWLLTVYVLIISVPTVAFAHADIVKSTPAEKEILNTAPSIVSVEFGEAIEPSNFTSLMVIDEKGNRVDLKNTSIDPKNAKLLTIGLKKNIPNGIYSIHWKVISEDGHPVQGVIPFGIKITGEEASKLQAKTTNYTPTADVVINRGLLYIGISLYIGVLFFHLVLYKTGSEQSLKAQSRSRTTIRFALASIIISVLLSLPIQAIITTSVTWLEAFRPSILQETLNLPNFGRLWIIQLIFTALLAITTYLSLKREKLSSLKVWTIPICILLGLMVVKSLNSHAASSQYKEIAIVINFLHLLAASLWVGGVAAIFFLLSAYHKEKRDHDQDWTLYWETIRRFTPWALGSGAILLLTGLLNSTFLVSTLHSLSHTGYGITLLVKVSLFIMIVLFGIFHLLKSLMRQRKQLKVTLGVEFSIGIVILIVAALLTNLQPPLLAATEPFSETKQLDNGYEITLSVSPNTVGVNTLDIHVKDQNGQPVTDVEQILVSVSGVGMTMAKPPINIHSVSPGEFEAIDKFFTMAGEWNIHVRGSTISSKNFDVNFITTVGNQQVHGDRENKRNKTPE
ncbi:TPA: copper resistance protein CopC [Bacillus cereus]|nr:copper resistance protein CopC [Bacillus cereus]